MTAFFTTAAAISAPGGDVTVILLFFGPPLLTVRGLARVIAKVIVGGRSLVDYDGFVDHGCCDFDAWGDMTVILLFFGLPLSTVRGVARVIAKVIVGGRSHVNCDGFVHHSCRRSWTPLLTNIAALLTRIFHWTTTQENPETLLMYNILLSFSRALFCLWFLLV